VNLAGENQTLQPSIQVPPHQDFNNVLGCIKKGVASREGNDCPPLLSSCETPSEVLQPGLGLPAQNRAIKMIRELGHLSYEKRLRELSLKKRRLWGDLVADFQYLKGVYKQEEWLLMRADSDRTRGNGFKLRQGRFSLDIRRKFFTQRVVPHWNKLPQEAVDAPSLEAFKARLDVALGSLVWWLATLHIAGGLKLDDHCGPFQPRPFCDSMICLILMLAGIFPMKALSQFAPFPLEAK